MTQTKSRDLRLKTSDELGQMMLDLKREQFNLRFQAASGQLSNTARVREVRRDIARVKTIIAQRSQNLTAKAA
ncbi:MAG: 50S ribosomal protein L29 [Candidatus Symbiobacter sp.]|nr:50S ribosomal protein L29 [Candidatus Symbiobacter sp.]